MSRGADYTLQAVSVRKRIISALEELRTASTCPTEQGILDRKIRKEVAELEGWQELLANTQQQ